MHIRNQIELKLKVSWGKYNMYIAIPITTTKVCDAHSEHEETPTEFTIRLQVGQLVGYHNNVLVGQWPLMSNVPVTMFITRKMIIIPNLKL